VLALLHAAGYIHEGVQVNGEFVAWPVTLWFALVGVVILTVTLHLARGLGQVHGRVARALLLSRDDE
jgi:hypothetical protein